MGEWDAGGGGGGRDKLCQTPRNFPPQEGGGEMEAKSPRESPPPSCNPQPNPAQPSLPPCLARRRILRPPRPRRLWALTRRAPVPVLGPPPRQQQVRRRAAAAAAFLLLLAALPPPGRGATPRRVLRLPLRGSSSCTAHWGGEEGVGLEQPAEPGIGSHHRPGRAEPCRRWLRLAGERRRTWQCQQQQQRCLVCLGGGGGQRRRRRTARSFCNGREGGRREGGRSAAPPHSAALAPLLAPPPTPLATAKAGLSAW